MKQDKTGRHKVVLTIDPMTIMVGANGDFVHSTVKFMLEATVYFEPMIKPLEDDPGADSYMEIISARTFVPLVLQGEGLSLVIDPSMNIVELLSEKQYDDLINLIYAENDFHVY